MAMYNIIRFHQRENKSSEVINENVTLKEAQRHCNDPDSSSATATSQMTKEYTKKHGQWFDGYMKVSDDDDDE